MIRVWLMADVLLHEQFSHNTKRVPAGTCLWLSDDQGLARDGHLVVYGAGCFDTISEEWLSFNPLERAEA